MSGANVAIASQPRLDFCESGSRARYIQLPESKQPSPRFRSRLLESVRDHSLTIFLGLTGIGWVMLYLKMNPEAKWGQVIGNIVSEWTQLLGLVLMTKRLIEAKSKESRR